MTVVNEPRALATLPASDIVYSFGSLVTDPHEYQVMVAAFRAMGFDSDDCEFLYADNSAGNRFDAFTAYNRFLLEARGRYVVLCHQDILPLTDTRSVLDERLEALTSFDGRWGLCGNAGGRPDGELVYRITQGDDEELNVGGPFPVRVISLDENFIVVRREANLALSRDLQGFHWYGSDLCIIADVLGWTAYVIDFHLFHKSRGNVSVDFREKARSFRLKYSRAFRPRWQYVPMSQPEFISSSPALTFLARAWHRVRRSIRLPFKTPPTG
jgi:hypothetical protein